MQNSDFSAESAMSPKIAKNLIWHFISPQSLKILIFENLNIFSPYVQGSSSNYFKNTPKIAKIKIPLFRKSEILDFFLFCKMLECHLSISINYCIWEKPNNIKYQNNKIINPKIDKMIPI